MASRKRRISFISAAEAEQADRVSPAPAAVPRQSPGADGAAPAGLYDSAAVPLALPKQKSSNVEAAATPVSEVALKQSLQCVLQSCCLSSSGLAGT